LCALGAVVALLFLPAVWLLPALDARVLLIMAGATPPPSDLHAIFVACELAKILVLSVLAVALVSQPPLGMESSETGRPSHVNG
jgi:hypothetical protein